jgi:hypothetical protein
VSVWPNVAHGIANKTAARTAARTINGIVL